MDSFAERLKHFREAKGWSQEKLIKESGVSKSSVYNYEAGKNLPNVVLLKMLCDALEVSAHDLIGF